MYAVKHKGAALVLSAGYKQSTTIKIWRAVCQKAVEKKTMTNISRKGVWAIVLGALAAATFIFFAWATSGFRNLDAATWFDYWGKGKVVKVAEPPSAQSAIVLNSSNDIDHTFVHDSDETSTMFAVSQAETPTVYIENPNDPFLTSVACCGTRVKITINDHGESVVYTSGTIKGNVGALYCRSTGIFR